VDGAGLFRRGAEMFWFWIIFFVPLIGAWAYFLAVKIHDFRQAGPVYPH